MRVAYCRGGREEEGIFLFAAATHFRRRSIAEGEEALTGSPPLHLAVLGSEWMEGKHGRKRRRRRRRASRRSFSLFE